MSQYFDNDESVISKERIIELSLYDKNIKFISDNGVFSKNKVDEGSIALLKVILPLSLGENILDLGCGYGTIGLSIAVYKETAHVTCADINTRALTLCNKNARINNLDSRVTCLESDIYENIKGKYDSIVINPPIRAGKKVIYSMFLGAKDYLIDGGSLYIVIRTKHGAESAKNYIGKVFNNVTLLKIDKGYRIYKATKQSD